MKNFSSTLLVACMFGLLFSGCSFGDYLKFEATRYASMWILTLVIGLVGLVVMALSGKN